MADRKTIMSWLEGLAQDDWAEWHSDSEVQTTAQAALDLLKEQESKKVINIYANWDFELIGNCPKCNAILHEFNNAKACGFCGQAVKWSDNQT